MFIPGLQQKPHEYYVFMSCMFLCNLYSFFFWFLPFFVKFTKFSHRVHNLFIIDWYTLFTVKEEIRLPDNKAYKINFFIIAQAPKGVWALLILRGFPVVYVVCESKSFCRFAFADRSFLILSMFHCLIVFPLPAFY